MNLCETPALERIARVIAGQRLSLNGDGDLESAGDAVDAAWRRYVEEARAILKCLREADADMATAWDPTVWTAMVHAALGDPFIPAARIQSPGAGAAIYQKPLG